MLEKKIEDCKNGIFILGINKVSMSLANIIAKKEINVFLWDFDNKIIEEQKNNFNLNNYISLLDISNCDFDKIDYIILSEDMTTADENLKTLLFRLEKIKEKVFLDVEFISELYPNNKYIALLSPDYDFIINSLLENIFKYSNVKAINTRKTFDGQSEDNDKEKDDIFNNIICYGGISDYKLNFIKNFKFNILAILDINEEIGKDEKLLKQRKNLISLQDEETIILMNTENKYIKQIYTEFNKDENLKCKIIPISVSKMLNNGISYVNNVIYNYYGNDNISYDLKENDYFTSYINKLALLSAFIISKSCGIERDIIAEALNSFNGVENCLEYVSQYNNIKFINNIAASNDVILKSPFDSYDNIYAIFLIDEKQVNGGFKKKEQDSRKNIKKVYLVDYVGLIGNDIVDNKRIFRFNNLNDAVASTIKDIENNENKEDNATVLLSPIKACIENTSKYGKYGDEYRNIVTSLGLEKDSE